MITHDELKKLAKLSSLQLEENEIPGLIKHISGVLEYASRVQEVARLAESTAPAQELVNIVRSDKPLAPNAELILAQVPEVTEHFIVVPRILEGH